MLIPSMGRISKTFSVLLFVILAVSSLIMIKPSFAQTSKPSVPEFKLSYTNNVYDVPAATSEWSGEPIPNSGSHVDYREVIIKVKNQPHDGYINGDVNGAREQLYYNVRVKNHFTNTWTELFGRTAAYINGIVGTGTWYSGSSDSECTYISISLNGPSNIIHTSTELSVGNQVDFQVKALIGYQNWENGTFFGEESAWSDTQTLIIDTQTSSSPSPTTTAISPNPTSSQTTDITPTATSAASDTNAVTVPLSTFITVVLVLAVVIVSLVLLLYRRRRGTAK